MHCPQCGQPFSSEVSFCKSCGLSLEATKQLFDPSGEPSAVKKWIKKMRRSRGRRGVYRGMIIIATGIALLAGTGGQDSVYSIVILSIGLLRILYAMAFQEVISTKAEYAGAMADGLKIKPAAAVGLPPAQTIPVGEYFPAKITTAEFAEIPSVTEDTTNLLNKADDQ